VSLPSRDDVIGTAACIVDYHAEAVNEQAFKALQAAGETKPCDYPGCDRHIDPSGRIDQYTAEVCFDFDGSSELHVCSSCSLNFDPNGRRRAASRGAS